MNKPNSEKSSEELLLQALRETPSASVTKGVRDVDKLSAEEEDGHGRWLKSQKKRLINKLYSWFMHFLFVIMCFVVLVLVVAAIYLTGKWISTFVNDSMRLGDFIGSIWNIVLVALATLFVNGLIPKD